MDQSAARHVGDASLPRLILSCSTLSTRLDNAVCKLLRFCSGCKTLNPLTSGAVVLLFVALQDVCNLGHKRIIGVGISQQRADGQKYLGDCEGWRPLVLENIEADCTVAVDVTVVNLGGEGHLGRLEGIVRREVDVQEEHAS